MTTRYDNFVVYVIDNGSRADLQDRLGTDLTGLFANLCGIDVSAVGAVTNRCRCTRHVAGATVLVRVGENLGYAGGNNVGIRLALSDDCEAIWILNNDARTAEDSLTELVTALEAEPRTAVVGSCVLDYDRVDTIQSLGGGTYWWPIAWSRPYASGVKLDHIGDYIRGANINYVSGAAMMIFRGALEDVGLLDERYFLYCEEVDFAERVRRCGWTLRVCPRAKVWHKEGATLGSSRTFGQRSPAAAFHASRSRVLVTMRFRPLLLPLVVLTRVVHAFVLAVLGHPRLAAASLRGIAAGLAAAGLAVMANAE